MRLATVRAPRGRRVVAQRAHDHAAHDVTDLASGDIKNLLPLDLSDLDLDLHPLIDLDTVTWLPPVPDPERIICIGLNYLSHAAEVMKDAPPWPTVFTRFPSTLVGHGEPLVRPATSDTLDWEGEIVVVIGRGGRHIQKAAALDHVAGYSVMGENSVREFQLHTTQAAAGKNWDSSGSWGPWIVSHDAVDGVPELVTHLNGVEKQRGNLGELAFDVPTLIAYVSTWTALAPGDVIATGTPAGIGHRESPPRYLQPGDELTVTMTGHMRLANPVIAETHHSNVPPSEITQEAFR